MEWDVAPPLQHVMPSERQRSTIVQSSSLSHLMGVGIGVNKVQSSERHPGSLAVNAHRRSVPSTIQRISSLFRASDCNIESVYE
jgi:hypothetical protein